MAGLLYLPRLFVYHCDSVPGSRQSKTFKVMERRLLKVIMTPAMIASWVFGLLLVWIFGFESFLGDFWPALKLGCVLGLTVCHFYFAVQVRKFAMDQNTLPSKHFRIMNEVPTMLMVGIVIFVVVKPF